MVIFAFGCFIAILALFFVIAIQDKNRRSNPALSASSTSAGNPPAPAKVNTGNSNDTNLLDPLPVFAGSNSITN